MKLRSSLFAGGLCALLSVFTPCIAGAARTYILVGVHHIYLVGEDPDLYLADRVEIEKTYADLVASDIATAQYRIANGAVPAEENRLRGEDLEQLARDRDDCLDELYETVDNLRETYPDFKLIDCDGPYQLVAVDYHAGRENGSSQREFLEGAAEAGYQDEHDTIDALTPMKPWPDYEASDDPYGGWVYGTRYTTSEFFTTWRRWRVRRRAGLSLPAFRGHAGRLPFERGRFVGRTADFVVVRGYAHGTGRLHKRGVIRRRRRRVG